MSSKFSKLPKTTFSGLEYQNIIEDIIALVKENPEYNQQYDDFLSSNAGRMLIELFAYITDQLATRIDFVVNENFLSTATQKSSVIKLLKLIGYSFKLPAAAKVNVRVSSPVDAEGKFFSKPFRLSQDNIELPFYLVAEDRNGDKKTFELLDIGINNKIDYQSTPEIENDKEYTFYEGKTYVDDFYVETENNQIFNLSNSSVIRNSVVVYRIKDSSLPPEELLKVDSFLNPEAQSSKINKYSGEINTGSEEGYNLPYKINIEANNEVQIEFPSSGVVKNETRRPSVGEHIRVFYRVGGGESGNIIPKSININKKIPIYDIDGAELSIQSIDFINNSYGVEGEEEESVENAILKAPTEIQTAKKTVTEDDYDAVLNSFDEILLSKSFGNSNSVSYSEKLYEEYGKYIDPMEVWNFVLMNKPGWESLDPTEYNNFNWFETRLDNRLNEPVAFSDGGNDKLYQLKEQDLTTVFLDEITELNGGAKDKITIAGITFDSSYLGNTITVIESSNENNINLERTIIGGSGQELLLDNDLIENTTSGDKYRLYDPYSYVFETPELFKDNTESDDFKFILTQTPAPVYYFDEISNISDFSETFTSESSGLTENIYPFFLSKKNLSNKTHLDGTLKIAIDGTEKTITFNEEKTITEICTAISEEFTFTGDSASDEVFYIKGDSVKNSAEIHNISHNMEKLRVGMEVGDSVEVTIKEVYIKEKYIVLSSAVSATLQQEEFKIKNTLISNAHKVATIENSIDGQYIILRSPTSGENSSISIFGDLANTIFGVNPGSFFRGIKKVSLNNEKNIVYRNSCKKLHEPKNVYLQYVVDNKTEVTIGNYYSSLEEGNPEYKEVADRIFATAYNKTTGNIDYFNSDFIIKFTKLRKTTTSLYSIQDDWELEQNTFPQVESKPITLPVADASLEINLDGSNFVINDISGPTIPSICKSINEKIQGKVSLEPYIYSSFNYAIPDGDKIVLRSPTNFSTSIIKVKEETNTYLFDSEKEDTPAGDYYIKIVGNEIKLYKSADSKIPDFPFFAHFVFDQRYSKGIYDGEAGRRGKVLGSVDEDVINLKLSPYKITGIENVYKKPVFKVFDLKGTITYDRAFSKTSIEKEVNNKLNSNFNLKASSIGKSIYKSKIVSLIHNIKGVLYFNVDYFGLDNTTQSTNQMNAIEASFDEIILLGKSNGKGLDIEYKSE